MCAWCGSVDVVRVVGVCICAGHLSVFVKCARTYLECSAWVCTPQTHVPCRAIGRVVHKIQVHPLGSLLLDVAPISVVQPLGGGGGWGWGGGRGTEIVGFLTPAKSKNKEEQKQLDLHTPQFHGSIPHTVTATTAVSNTRWPTQPPPPTYAHFPRAQLTRNIQHHKQTKLPASPRTYEHTPTHNTHRQNITHKHPHTTKPPTHKKHSHTGTHTQAHTTDPHTHPHTNTKETQAHTTTHTNTKETQAHTTTHTNRKKTQAHTTTHTQVTTYTNTNHTPALTPTPTETQTQHAVGPTIVMIIPGAYHGGVLDQFSVQRLGFLGECVK